MYYETFLIVLLVVALCAPFAYGNLWKPRIINKSSDFFVVSKIERMTMTFRKWVFVYGSFLWIVFLYDDAYYVITEGASDRIGTLIVKLFFLCVWNLLMLLCCRNHTSLPTNYCLNADEMIQSIERERFYQIGEKLWYSQNWVRISTKFYPKSIITGITTEKGFKSSLVSINVHTIHEKEYQCNDFSYYDKRLTDKVNQLIENLPISELADLDNAIIRNGLRFFRGREMFKKYMESHTTTEFIHSTELLNSVVSIIQEQSKEI